MCVVCMGRVCVCVHTVAEMDWCVSITLRCGTQEREGVGTRVETKGSDNGAGLEKTRGKVERLHREVRNERLKSKCHQRGVKGPGPDPATHWLWDLGSHLSLLTSVSISSFHFRNCSSVSVFLTAIKTR